MSPPRKTPVIRQTGLADCGAACLAMILATHGKKVPLPELKKRMKIGESGVNALVLLKTAKHYGLRGRGVEANLAGLRKVELPAIVHLGHRHFVVLIRFTEDLVEIIDPGLGRQKLTREQFELLFSGAALLFTRP